MSRTKRGRRKGGQEGTHGEDDVLVDDVWSWLSIHHVVMALLHPLLVDVAMSCCSSSTPCHRREAVESLALLPHISSAVGCCYSWHSCLELEGGEALLLLVAMWPYHFLLCAESREERRLILASGRTYHRMEISIGLQSN
jgi:hypothetical protein